MNRKDKVILEKIIKYSREAKITLAEINFDIEKFKEGGTSKNAISMCILQTGELASKLTQEFIKNYLICSSILLNKRTL